MKTYLRLAIILFLNMMLLFSCYKDLGNYDYNEINEIEINGFETGYSIKQFDTLTIRPEISQSLEEAPLSYSWRIIQSLPTTIEEVISTDRDLNVQIAKAPGSYTLLFEAIDPSTKVGYFEQVKLDVLTSYSEGLLFLYETANGNSEVGILQTDWLIPGLIKDKISLSLFSAANPGKVLTGKPRCIDSYYHSNIRDGNCVVILTTAGGVLLGGLDFVQKQDINKMFYSAPDTIDPMIHYFNMQYTYTRVLINNGGVHMMQANQSNDNKMPDRIVGDYFAAPFLIENWRYLRGADATFYDQKYKRFLMVPSWTVNIGKFNTIPNNPTTGLPPLFQFNNIGKEMVFWGEGLQISSSQGLSYGVFKDNPGGPSDFWLYEMNFNFKTTTAGTVGLYQMDNCPDIDKAKIFATGHRGPVFYYAVGNKIYFYNFKSTNSASVYLSLPSEEEITYMKVFRTEKNLLNQADNINDGKILFVATYNPSNPASGTIYLYKVDELTGAIDPVNFRKYTGFGKIVNTKVKKDG